MKLSVALIILFLNSGCSSKMYSPAEANRSVVRVLSKDDFLTLKNYLRNYSQIPLNENVECGTSGMVLPDRTYILVRSDPHFEILNYSGEEIKKPVKMLRPWYFNAFISIIVNR